MKRYKVISAGHLCLDITPVFPAELRPENLGQLFVPGKLIHMEEAKANVGGSVANTGVAMKLLGSDVRFLGKVGRDPFGEMVKASLRPYGVEGMIEDEEDSTSYTVVLAVPGHDRVFLHNPGANDGFTNEDIPESDLEDAALFHFGYPPLMRSMFADGGQELTKMFRRMKEHGIATSLDFAAIDPESEAGKADWRAILTSVLPYVDFFVPSFEELCFMLDRERYDRLSKAGGDMTEGLGLLSEVKPLADELIDMGCRTVLIKCGVSGMFYKTADAKALSEIGSRVPLDPELWGSKEGIQPCFRADIVRSGTGAGDTSIAAFLSGMLQGYPPADCAALAAAEGACCVTTYDALSGLRSLEELMDRIRSGWPTM